MKSIAQFVIGEVQDIHKRTPLFISLSQTRLQKSADNAAKCLFILCKIFLFLQTSSKMKSPASPLPASDPASLHQFGHVGKNAIISAAAIAGDPIAAPHHHQFDLVVRWT
jgi:hypothetical protein